MTHRDPATIARVVVPVLLAGLAVPALAAQEPDLPSPEEIEAARTAPLFATHEPLVLTLETDVERLKDERDDERPPQPATISYRTDDGREVRIPLEVEPRGNFRREKRNCTFPPVRLDFDRDGPELEETVFAGENRLKLVVPCREGSDTYQRYLFREYAAYRMMNELHEISFRVRLLDLTWVHTEGDREPLRVHAFLIEDDARMAARASAVRADLPQLHPLAPGNEYVTLVALFQLMIGNTDWDPTVFHNVELVRTPDARYLTVPYDFDFAGAVDARYASPDPGFPIDDVRERLYRGFCVETVDMDALAARFVERREAMFAAVRAVPAWEDGDREDFLDYVAEFWDILEDPVDRRVLIEERCRGWKR